MATNKVSCSNGGPVAFIAPTGFTLLVSKLAGRFGWHWIRQCAEGLKIDQVEIINTSIKRKPALVLPAWQTALCNPSSPFKLLQLQSPWRLPLGP
jgi:hypothetical protein